MKKILLSLALATSIINAQNIGIDSVGLNVGYTYMPTTQTDKKGSTTLANEPDAHYGHIELYTLLSGLFDDSTIKPTINAIFAKNNEFTNSLLMVGINKYYEYDKHDFYYGLLIGEGEQKWGYNPLNGTKDNDYSALSPVAALQVGAEYMIQDNLALGLNIKGYAHDYTTTLDPSATASSEIVHRVSASVSIGLRYVFGGSAPKQEITQPIEQIPAVVVLDIDKDGVLNENDICPKTPLHKTVDEEGCQRLQSSTIAFAPNYVKLDERYMETLKSYALFLREHPSYSAKIVGYSDSMGSKRSNQLLSQGRADVIATYFMAKGVDPKQLSYEGKGETNPIGDNATKEGRAKNRRVEITYTRESKK